MYIQKIIAGLIIIAIALVVVDMAVEWLNPPTEDEEKISQNSSFSHQITLMGDDVIKGDFTVANDTVNFFICDDENYKDYKDSKNHRTIETFELQENATNGTFTFTTPEEDSIIGSKIWHIVFDTQDSNGSKTTVDYTIEYEPYRTLVYYAKIILLALGAIRILQGLMPKKKPKEQANVLSPNPTP